VGMEGGVKGEREKRKKGRKKKGSDAQQKHGLGSAPNGLGLSQDRVVVGRGSLVMVVVWFL